MPYVAFETMENEETVNLAEKSTILDGRRVVVVSSSCRRRRRGNVELKPLSPPVGDGVGARLGAELGNKHVKQNGDGINEKNDQEVLILVAASL